jgi:hypothetical protein
MIKGRMNAAFYKSVAVFGKSRFISAESNPTSLKLLQRPAQSMANSHAFLDRFFSSKGSLSPAVTATAMVVCQTGPLCRNWLTRFNGATSQITCRP